MKTSIDNLFRAAVISSMLFAGTHLQQASASNGSDNAPTMGWSSWNTYRVNISDSLITSQADALVSTGLKQAGYNHINIDDGYFGGRDSSGRLLIHPTRFPRGLKPVVDHIHSLGLRAGIYSDAGRNTCGSYYDNDTIARGVGLYGNDSRDAEFFFKTIGFDFIKVDFCGGDPPQNSERLDLDEEQRYREISRAIRATGRDDVRLNVCRWNYPGTWVSDVGFSWRISHDIQDNWPSVKDIIGQNLYLSAYCRGGHYNDMDMLEVGRSLSETEDRTHFGLWCVMSSPLLIGCDLTTIKPETLSLITNPELIALNQDRLHLQAYVADTPDSCYVLVKDIGQLHGKKRCVAVYNPTDRQRNVSVAFSKINLGGNVKVRDIFNRADIGRFNDSIIVALPPHATEIFLLTAGKRLMRTTYEAETAFIGNYQEIKNPHAVNSGYYAPAPACSGGMKAVNLGGSPDNDLMWDNVNVPDKGRYRLSVSWQTDTTAAFSLIINGETIATFECQPSGSGVTTSSVTVQLRKGNNEVRLQNSAAPMPDIDCLIVDKD